MNRRLTCKRLPRETSDDGSEPPPSRIGEVRTSRPRRRIRAVASGFRGGAERDGDDRLPEGRPAIWMAVTAIEMGTTPIWMAETALGKGALPSR